MEKDKIKEFLQSLADAGGNRIVDVKGPVKEGDLKEMKELGYIIIHKGKEKFYGDKLRVSILTAGTKLL